MTISRKSIFSFKKKPTSKEPIELKSSFTISNIPIEILDLAGSYLDGQSLARFERSFKFLNSNEHQLEHWKNAVLKEITEQPKLKPGQSFKNFYQCAYSYKVRIQKTLAKKNVSQDTLNALFAQIVLNGYEKYAPLLIKHVNLNALLDIQTDSNGINNSFIHLAAERGHTRFLRLLLDKGIPVNYANAGLMPGNHGYCFPKDGCGVTALVKAAAHGHTECLNLLLERKANVNAASCDFKITALHVAAENGHLDCINLLLQAGAKVDVQDLHERLPLHFALQKRHTECAERLRMEMEKLNIPINAPLSCVIL